MQNITHYKEEKNGQVNGGGGVTLKEYFFKEDACLLFRYM